MPSATASPSRGKKTKNYYAVPRSPLLEKPAIFTSWARAHVVTTGIKWQDYPFKGFKTLAEAKDWMELHGAVDYDTVEQEEEAYEGPNTSMTYYAVANGRNPGITEVYEGPGGAQDEVHEFSGSCHQSFPTRRQAEQFIKDWEDQTVSVAGQKYRRPPLAKGGASFASLPPVEAVKQEELEDAFKRLGIGK